MKIGIMQPYFFPYLGYWQLMNAVDTYVILDDVAYIKRGWINRNQIKSNDSVQRIGIQIQHASQNKNINELYLVNDKKEKDKLIKSLERAYKKAPYYYQTMEIIKKVLDYEENNLAKFLSYSIYEVANYLEMNTTFILSSEIEKNENLKGQEKIIDICKCLKGDTYINAIGGKELYDSNHFFDSGIKLYFLEMNIDIVYPQGKGNFIPSLSIIDVMMYNSKIEIQKMLNMYKLEYM